MDKELEQNLLALRAKGATDDQIREYARQWQAQHAQATTELKPEVMDFVRAALQGPTLGLYRAAAKHVLPNGEDVAQRMDWFEKNYPKTALALGLGTGFVGAGKNVLFKGLERVGQAVRPLANAAGVLAPVVEGAAVGGTAGAVSGAANADEGNVVGGAVTGGLAGAAGGGLLGGITAPFLPGNPQLRRLADIANRSGGINEAEAALGRHQAAGTAPETFLADLLPGFRAEAKRVSTASPIAGDAIRQAAAERQAGASEKLAHSLSKKAPVISERAAQLEAERSQWADEAYGALEDASPTADAKAFKKVLDTKATKAKLSEAGRYFPKQDPVGGMNLSDEERQFLTDLLHGASPTSAAAMKEALGEPPQISYGQIRTLMQLLRDKAESLGRDGKRDAARKVWQAFQSVYDAAERAIPGLKAVNAEFEGRMRLSEALDAGAKAWTKSPAEIRYQMRHFGEKRVAAMTPDELEQFRFGLAAKIHEELTQAATNRDMASRWAHNARGIQDKLRVVFGDEPQFQQFMKEVDARAELARLRGAPEGSDTEVKKQMTLHTGTGTLLGLGTLAASHNPAYAGIAALSPTLMSAARRAEAMRMLPLLLQRGDALRPLLQQIERAGAARPIPPAALGGAGLAGLFSNR